MNFYAYRPPIFKTTMFLQLQLFSVSHPSGYGWLCDTPTD